MYVLYKTLYFSCFTNNILLKNGTSFECAEPTGEATYPGCCPVCPDIDPSLIEEKWGQGR